MLEQCFRNTSNKAILLKEKAELCWQFAIKIVSAKLRQRKAKVAKYLIHCRYIIILQDFKFKFLQSL